MSGFRPFFTSSPGVKYFKRDNGDGTSTYVGEYDCTPIIEANREEYKQDVKGRLAAKGRWGVKMATVPVIFLNKWMQDHLDPRDPEASAKLNEIMMRKLDDPDYRDFRTANFKA